MEVIPLQPPSEAPLGPPPSRGGGRPPPSRGGNRQLASIQNPPPSRGVGRPPPYRGGIKPSTASQEPDTSCGDIRPLAVVHGFAEDQCDAKPLAALHGPLPVSGAVRPQTSPVRPGTTAWNGEKLSLIDDGVTAERPTSGDGGMVNHRLANAALERRGNVAMQRDLRDQCRIFDGRDEKKWDKKYKYFSGNHMKTSYRLFAQARHDPFNKDPSWSKSMIANIAGVCSEKGVSPRDLFIDVDKSADGMLNRAEMRRVLLSVDGKLSDMEINGVFDAVDHDSSGEVSVQEFCESLEHTNGPISREDTQRYRNPLHRVQRLAPAKVEGWDHLGGPGSLPSTLPATELIDQYQLSMRRRLGDIMLQTPRQRDMQERTPKYQYFCGGADSSRFARRAGGRKEPPDGQTVGWSPCNSFAGSRGSTNNVLR